MTDITDTVTVATIDGVGTVYTIIATCHADRTVNYTIRVASGPMASTAPGGLIGTGYTWTGAMALVAARVDAEINAETGA